MPDPNGNPYPWETSGGATGEGTWTEPEQGRDGKWYQYNSKTGEYREAKPPPTAPLIEDLQRLGLVPVDVNTGEVGYPNESPIGRTSVEAGHAIRTYADPQTGVLYDAKGARLPQYLQKYLGGVGGDPYAGARLAETVRQNRIAEAMEALDLQTLRQKATLAGAQFAVNPENGPYFPSMSPTSPAVRAGLIDPFKYQPIGYGSNIGEDQTAKDLQMIRRLAGVQ